MALTYKWQVSTDSTGSVFVDIPANSILYEGLNTNTLILKTLTPEENAKKYRVIIGSTDYDIPPIISRAATLFTVPTITLSTVQDVNTSNTSAAFSVSGSVNTGVLSYQWQKRTLCSPGISDPCFLNLQDEAGKVSGSRTPTLSLTNLSSINDNNTQYRVVASAQCCGTAPITKSSNLAALQVIVPGQTVIITNNISDSTINSNSVTFNISAQVSALQTFPNTTYPQVTFTWQKLVNGVWTNTTGAATTTTSDISISSRLYSQNFIISNAANSDQFRVIISDTRSSVTSITARAYTPTPCLNCGGGGGGDPHYRMLGPGIKDWTYGFDDNPISNGHKEIIMVYVKNLDTNTEHIVACKNTGSFGLSAPYSIEKVTYIQKENGQIVQTIQNGKFNIMDLLRIEGSSGDFRLRWTGIESDNISKTQNLNIVIGGVWYWMCKSLIEYLKRNPLFTNIGWPYIGFITADGIGIGLAPYGLIREDFETENLRIIGAGKNIDGLYISHSKDSKSAIRYNKDNSAYSILDIGNSWNIGTRTLSGVQFKRVSNSKFSISFSKYIDAESLSVGLGVKSAVITGNPVISSIVFTEIWDPRTPHGENRKQENITAEITISNGSITGDGSATFGYFVNTVSGSNTVTMPENFNSQDFYIGQQIRIPGSLTDTANISAINGSVITLDKNLTGTGRNPIELIYASSSGASTSPDLARSWTKSDGSVTNIQIVKSVYSEEGLSKITENIKNNSKFWNELSLLLNGKKIPIDNNTNNQAEVKEVVPVRINTIVKHPQDTSALVVNNQSTATFSVITQFSDGTVYQWQKSIDKGVTWSNISQTNTNNLIVSNGENNSLYRVVIDNNITSNAAKLVIPDTLKISRPPSDQSAVNLEAVFSVLATGVSPLVYKWEKSDDSGKNYNSVPSGNLSSLVLTNLTEQDDADLYRVIVQDGAGEKYTSPGSKLTINPKLSVVLQPTNQTASLSETATFQTSGVCDNGGLKYQWEVSVDNGATYAPYGNLITSGILNLTNLKIADDNKLFRAKLISNIKNNIIYTNSAKLSVPNTIVVNSQPANTVSISGTATFSVNASTTNPPLSYQWQKSNTQKGIYTDIVNATGSSITIDNLTLADDNTYYRAELTDDRGFLFSSSAYVDTTPQVSLTQDLDSVYSLEGYNTTLSVSGATTGGTIKYSWEKSDPNSSVFAAVSGAESSLINLSLSPIDSGIKYRAKLNVDGARQVVSNTATLLVNPQTIFLNKNLPKVKRINYPNNAIELSIDATSQYLPLTYQWQVSKTTKNTLNYQLVNNDIFYDSVALNLDMNGSNTSKVFIDSSKNKIPVGLYRNNDLYMSGDISLSNTSFISGPTSAKFNDIYTHMRVLDTGNKLQLLNKNFTIEYWYRPTEYNSDMAGISRRINKSWPDYGDNGWVISATKFRAKIGSTWRDDWIDDSANLENIEPNQWHHVALSRHNNTYRLFRDGILIGDFTNGDPLDDSAPYVVIGASSSTSISTAETNYGMKGFVDNVKITIGVAKYMVSFIPDAIIDNTYNFTYNTNQYENIPDATGSILLLDNLNYTNNLEKYRVVIQDAFSTITVEE